MFIFSVTFTALMKTFGVFQIKISLHTRLSVFCFTRYESVVGTIAKKFKNKRKLPETSEDEVEEVETIEARAKRGFIKPKVKPSDEFEF